MAPTIDSGDMFRLRNDHPDQALVVRLGMRGKPYSIEPGKSGLVPFELIRVYWGDPRSRPGIYVKFSDSKERGYVNKREDEIARLGNLYGTFAGTAEELCNPEWPVHHPMHGMARLTPWPVSIQTEAGEEVIPACFDFTHERVYASVQTDTEDLTDQATYQAHLEARLDAITEELRAVKGREGDDAEVDVPVR